MNVLHQALELADRGFYVFPCLPNDKRPAINDFPNRATRDALQIKRWFGGDPRNIGISTSRFKDHEALVVVDVDKKGQTNGEYSILALELEGFGLPPTFEQSTPSGGRHLVYSSAVPLRQGVNKLGAGIDIRSRGGYVVGPGSQIDGKPYVANSALVAPAPDWLVTRLGRDDQRADNVAVVVHPVSTDRADGRAADYLMKAAAAVEGAGGDLATFKVAAHLKDLGVAEERAYQLMAEHWNPRCEPPWQLGALRAKVRHAYRYGREPVGSRAPEAVFDAVEKKKGDDEPPHPIDALNDQFAFVKDGAYILNETTDHRGRYEVRRMTPADLHQWSANKFLMVGEKKELQSKLWMASPRRREYDSVVFCPQKVVESRFYNLWRGFTVQPADTADHPAVRAFQEHLHENVCNADNNLAAWLLGYFAHLIQRPGEKPLTATVYQGQKGVGKNALVERVGALLGRHFMVADDDRYLLSNFNGHLEASLFLVLDEAAWAGDKRAEGRLKSLITGSEHLIERKGAEMYRSDNLTRVAFLGNDDWLIPASVDERRFAVFQVGTGRKQDRKFFENMRKGMEAGGYSNLLRLLLDYDISLYDFNAAPQTKGLTEQKHQSLDPVCQWWLDCLRSDEIVGSSLDGSIPDIVDGKRLHEAFGQYAKSRQIKSWLPGRNDFYERLRVVAPRYGYGKLSKPTADGKTYGFRNPGIKILRQDWEAFIGGPCDWKE